MSQTSDFKLFSDRQLRMTAEQVRGYLLKQMSHEFSDISRKAVRELGVPRQTIYKQLKRLESDGIIEGRGRTNAREHRLAVVEHRAWYRIQDLDEYRVWEEFAEPLLDGLTDSVQSICRYGFTEMVNNAIDHSESEQVLVSVERSHTTAELTILDRGVGIFRKVQRALQLPSPQEAIFELSKGKFTTDPARHTGEGIFYTSRMFDQFRLLSAGLFLSHDRNEQDWLSGADEETKVGTTVFLTIHTDATQTMNEIFEHYSVPREDFAFNKTNVILRLLDTGDQSFVSRSQAKRVLARLPRFREVILNFDGVKTVGPAFADEIFRVFSNAHPEVHLLPANTSDEVQRMIDRVKLRQEEDAEHLE
jgi:anti-sigma regulatory factor (Ser/Thr protein kinase)